MNITIKKSETIGAVQIYTISPIKALYNRTLWNGINISSTIYHFVIHRLFKPKTWVIINNTYIHYNQYCRNMYIYDTLRFKQNVIKHNMKHLEDY